tara:strand:- start:46 stop:207 length:162 start_codon:yes stop_codon:yes gene_type:complete
MADYYDYNEANAHVIAWRRKKKQDLADLLLQPEMYLIPYKPAIESVISKEGEV